MAKGQQMFNKVYRHLLAQNKVSQKYKYSCLYRGPRGLKCAIGVLIPDSEYHPDMEGQGCDEGPLKKYVRVNPALAMDLQRVHDLCPIEKWRDRLSTVATRHGLKVPNV